jgi:hypothetical protein
MQSKQCGPDCWTLKTATPRKVSLFTSRRDVTSQHVLLLSQTTRSRTTTSLKSLSTFIHKAGLRSGCTLRRTMPSRSLSLSLSLSRSQNFLTKLRRSHTSHSHLLIRISISLFPERKHSLRGTQYRYGIGTVMGSEIYKWEKRAIPETFRKLWTQKAGMYRERKNWV